MRSHQRNTFTLLTVGRALPFFSSTLGATEQHRWCSVRCLDPSLAWWPVQRRQRLQTWLRLASIAAFLKPSKWRFGACRANARTWFSTTEAELKNPALWGRSKSIGLSRTVASRSYCHELTILPCGPLGQVLGENTLTRAVEGPNSKI